MNTDLAIRYIKGLSTPLEKQEFESWLNNSDNFNEFTEFRKYWNLSKKAYRNFNPDSISAWRKVDSTITTTSQNNNRALINNFLKIAASVVIILSVGFFLLKSEWLKHEDLIVYKSAEKVIPIILPDSTRIWLNAESELKAPKVFSGKIRHVYLKGEAFFQVAKDRKKPFHISTVTTSIEVLGTSFNVKSEALDSIVKVDVVTGVVAFTNSDDKNKRIILKKGQKGTFIKSSGNILRDESSNMNFLAWKTGKLNFRNASLNEINTTLAEFYHLHSSMETESISNKYLFTGSFDNVPLTEALNIIELTTGVKYYLSGDSIKVVFAE